MKKTYQAIQSNNSNYYKINKGSSIYNKIIFWRINSKRKKIHVKYIKKLNCPNPNKTKQF